MNRGISLVLLTKTGVVQTGFFLTADYHVDLAYRVVEAGIYGTMTKKYWYFALTSRDEVAAMLPMYKKVERNGVTKFNPRIAPDQVRGSVSGLLVGLEALVDGAETRRQLDNLERQRELSAEADALEAIIKRDRPVAPAEAAGVQSPGVEMVTLPDGSTMRIDEWSPATPEEFYAAMSYGGTSSEDGSQGTEDNAVRASNGAA